MDDSSGAAGRKQVVPAHRRSRSEVPFAGYFPPPTQQLPQPKAEAGGWGDGTGGDDLFSSYLNLEGMDVLNSSSPDSSAKADSSENGDSEECAAWGAGAGVKRSAAGELIYENPRRGVAAFLLYFSQTDRSGYLYGEISPKILPTSDPDVQHVIY